MFSGKKYAAALRCAPLLSHNHHQDYLIMLCVLGLQIFHFRSLHPGRLSFMCFIVRCGPLQKSLKTSLFALFWDSYSGTGSKFHPISSRHDVRLVNHLAIWGKSRMGEIKFARLDLWKLTWNPPPKMISENLIFLFKGGDFSGLIHEFFWGRSVCYIDVPSQERGNSGKSLEVRSKGAFSRRSSVVFFFGGGVAYQQK